MPLRDRQWRAQRHFGGALSGKPIFSFPIANVYEQYLNARFLSELGYGQHAENVGAAEPLLDDFHRRLDEFKASIKKTFTLGNDPLKHRLNEVLDHPLSSEIDKTIPPLPTS